jgi:hypothetical protein
MTDILFSDTEEKPTGRKARTVPKSLWEALEDSAKRGVAKVAESDKEVIGDLLKDLGSAAVRKRYTLTTATKATDTGGVRLTFHAVAKTPEPASAERPEAAAPPTASADPHQAKRRG